MPEQNIKSSEKPVELDTSGPEVDVTLEDIKEEAVVDTAPETTTQEVVEEVKKHFGKMVFKSIIQRNIRLSEAPSFGESIIDYDATSKGAKNYLSLANEIIKKTKKNN